MKKIRRYRQPKSIQKGYIICSDCKGQGCDACNYKGKFKCPSCKGSGEHKIELAGEEMTLKCNICNE